MNNYSDIINMKYPFSKKHAPMPLHDRAAQFAPFAALSGYDEAIAETARRTDKRLELSAEQEQKLNLALKKLGDNLGSCPLISVRFFIPDPKKSGGSYMTVHNTARRIDFAARELIFTDGFKIDIDNIEFIEFL